MALTNDQITAQNFKDFYTQILPYLNGGNYVEKSVTEGLLKNDGTVDTTISGAVSANTSAISGIKDGQSIDSFADVETALATKNTVFIWDTTYTSASASDIDITLSEMPSFNVGDLLVLKVNANLTFNGNASYGWGFSFTVGGASYAWTGNVKRISSYTGYSTKAFTDNLSKGVCLTFVCTAVSNNIPDLLLISKESAETMSTTATLSTSAQTTVTFTRADLTTDSDVEVGISEWGLVPDDVTLSSGSCTVTLPIVDSAHSVTVKLYVR